MADGSVDSRVYWAAERDQTALIKRCMERFGWHLDALKSSGRWDSMRSLLGAYYGRGTDGERDSGGLRDAGDDGETTEMHTNQVRPIIANTMSLIVGQWPEVKPRAKNESAKSLAETRLALEIHKAYEEKSSGQSRIIDAVRGGLIASAWTLGHSWAAQDGKEWALDKQGAPVFEGDVQEFVLPPWRCVYDFAAADESSRRWVLFRRPMPRWDVAANIETLAKAEQDAAKKTELTALAEKVRQYSGSGSTWAGRFGGAAAKQMQGLDALFGESLPDEDVVWVWELRHLPSPALSPGRLVRFIEPDVVLWDSLEQRVGYPYEGDQLHVREYAPERVVAGGAGHTGAFDLAGMQEFIDLCTTSMASTINVNGQNRFWGGGGDGGATVRALGINGAVVESAMKPEVLDFPALKPEVVEAADWAKGGMQESMALNNVVMGNPDKGMPAQAMALLKATAIQYHAVAQGEFVRLVKWNANSRLRLLKRFAKSERTTQLVGKGRAYELKKWSEKDIAGVEGFDVEVVNPSANTFESRAAIGEMFVTKGIMSPEAYLAFVQTGNLEQGLATKTAQKELVESNVELLQDGVGLPPVDMAQMKPLMEEWNAAAMQAGATGMDPPPKPLPIFASTPPNEKVLRVYKSDPHHLAIPAYLAVLSSPTSRGDANLVKVATEVIQLSLQFWQSLSPDEAACYGIPPLPSQMMAAGMPPEEPGAPSADVGTDEPPPGQPSGEGTPAEGDIQQPKDPTTGEAVPGAGTPA